MVTAEARIETSRASRYLVQLCRHASQMGRHRGTRPHGPGHADMPRDRPDQVAADWSDTSGTITLTPWGRCVLGATPDALVLHVEAPDTENLHRIQALLGWNLTRFGRRDRLTVTWQPFEGSEHPTAAPARHGHRRTVMLTTTSVLGVVLVIALHLGVGGGALAASGWLGWTAAGLVITPILLVVAHAAIPVAILRLRRRRARATSSPDPATNPPGDDS